MGKYVIQGVSISVLSRLLGAEQFGLYAIVMAIAGIATIVGDFGLSLASIRDRNLTQAEKSNLFWINSAVGATITVLVIGVSGPMGLVYDDPRLTDLAVATAIVFLMNGVRSQFAVELNRSGRFGTLALSDVASNGIALVTAVVTALCGWGYWALAVQLVTQSVTQLLYVSLSSKWRPGKYTRGASIRRFVSFGSYATLAFVFNYLASNAPTVFGGKFFGADFAGRYNRAMQFSQLPVSQVTGPLTNYATIDIERTQNSQELNAAVEKWVGIICVPMFGILSLVVALADQLVEIVLGPGWPGVGAMIRVLAIAAAFQSASYLYYWTLAAKGEARALFLLELPGRVITITLAVVLSIVSTPEMLLWSTVAGQAVIWAIGLFLVPKLLGFKLRSLVAPQLRIWVTALVSAAFSLVCQNLPMTASIGFLPLLAIGFVSWTLTFIALAMVTGAWRSIKVAVKTLLKTN